MHVPHVYYYAKNIGDKVFIPNEKGELEPGKIIGSNTPLLGLTPFSNIIIELYSGQTIAVPGYKCYNRIRDAVISNPDLYFGITNKDKEIVRISISFKFELGERVWVLIKSSDSDFKIIYGMVSRYLNAQLTPPNFHPNPLRIELLTADSGCLSSVEVYESLCFKTREECETNYQSIINS